YRLWSFWQPLSPVSRSALTQPGGPWADQPPSRMGEALSAPMTFSTSGHIMVRVRLGGEILKRCSSMNPCVRIAWVTLMVLLPLVGCWSQGSDLPVLSSKPDVSAYHLGPGDRVEIKVLGADELNGQYSVQDDGTIRMLMVGEVMAASFTPEQVQARIEDKLKAGRYITQPHASVAVLTYRPFYILGEVASPGG